jgi:hypothetical protein
MLIHINNFYNFQPEIPKVISNLNFVPKVYGEEIENFNAVNISLDEIFSEILGQKIIIKTDSGVFRKPYETIHFENFSEKIRFVAYMGIEKNVFKTFRHKETGSLSVFGLNKELNLEDFIKSNCYDLDKWEQKTEINLDLGDLIITRPWFWQSLSNKTTQIFYLETEDGS